MNNYNINAIQFVIQQHVASYRVDNLQLDTGANVSETCLIRQSLGDKLFVGLDRASD